MLHMVVLVQHFGERFRALGFRASDAVSTRGSLFHPSDASPIFSLDIRIDLDWFTLSVQTIGAVLPRSRNPVVLVGLDVVEIRLESPPFQPLKGAPAVIDSRRTRAMPPSA